MSSPSSYRTPDTFRAIFFAMRSMGVAVGNVQAGLVNLFKAFLPLVTVGATFLPGLTGGFEGVTARLAEFMRQAERSGALRDFIQGGIDSIAQLVETTKQLFRIGGNIGAVFGAMFSSVSAPAGSLLDTFENLTEEGGTVH